MSKEEKDKQEPKVISRRQFLKNAGLVVGGAAAMGAVGAISACSPQTTTETKTVTQTTTLPGTTSTATTTVATTLPGTTKTVTSTSPPTTVTNNVQLKPWIPSKWDAEYDLVVLGFGGAGASTSITAADKGAKVLLLEKAPEGEEGGNTGVCGGEAYSHQDIPSAIAYITALCDDFKIDPAYIQRWAEMLKDNGNFMTNVLECQTTTWRPWEEFPELPGSTDSGCWICGPKPDNGWGHNLFDLYRAAVLKRSNIDVWYESPGLKLIQDYPTKEILGVVAQKGAGGAEVNIKAKKAVALCCGGFQNNQRMIQDFLHIPAGYPKGTPYATGDGVKMGLEVGADLWHMNNVAGPDFNLKVPELRMSFGYSTSIGRRACIYVGRDGTRFWDEASRSRHGKIQQAGTWIPTPMPLPVHAIFDSTAMASRIYSDTGTMSWWTVHKEYPWSEDNSAELAKGWIKKADTIKELAGIIGKDPDTLDATVTRYNEFCANGVDLEFGKPANSLLPLATPPFFAMELMCTFTNTQGGPRRNKDCQVVDPSGNPIPRLYSNGELGAMYSHAYNGGGNIGEAMAFGRVLGEHAVALTPWS